MKDKKNAVSVAYFEIFQDRSKSLGLRIKIKAYERKDLLAFIHHLGNEIRIKKATIRELFSYCARNGVSYKTVDLTTVRGLRARIKQNQQSIVNATKLKIKVEQELSAMINERHACLAEIKKIEDEVMTEALSIIDQVNDEEREAINNIVGLMKLKHREIK